MRVGGGQIAPVVANSKRMVDFFVCEKSFQQQKSRQKITQVLRTNNSSLSESYHANPHDPHSLAGKLQSYISNIENGLTCVYI